MKQNDSKNRTDFFTEIGIALRRDGYDAPPPTDGFICWGGDHGCIRSITEKTNKRQEEK